MDFFSKICLFIGFIFVSNFKLVHSEWKTLSSSSDNPCAYNSGVIFVPNLVNCNQYYACMNEQAFPMFCDSGLTFDIYANRCRQSTLVDACTENLSVLPSIMEKDNPCMDNEGIKLVSDLEDPSSFYICVGESPVRFTCNGGTVFDLSSRDCITVSFLPTTQAVESTTSTESISSGTAPTTTLADISTTTIEEISASTTSTVPSESPITDTTLSVGSSSTTISPTTTITTTTTTSRTSSTSVPPTTTPTADALHCSVQQNTFLPHPDCSKFYQCFYGYLFVISCPQNQYWNQDREFCDYFGNVICNE
ncbi:location of vulva defective 1-like [Sabethes cyaneus]|uniref:location of vulva defective 1-like n=1 Tax=Sabethes cyaneus TaxID=53552 RepID=UPI00237DEE35|nr:location of vulva defective 1-like [Sabethes cyaneus]